MVPLNDASIRRKRFGRVKTGGMSVLWNRWYKQALSCPVLSGQGFFYSGRIGDAMEKKSFGGRLLWAAGLVLFALVNVLWFIIGISTGLLTFVYLAAAVILAVVFNSVFLASPLLYLIIAGAGYIVLLLISFLCRGVLTAVRNELMTRLFGQTSEASPEEVPSFCARPFDPKETALLELERRYASNALTEEEYEKEKRRILSNESQQS